MLGRRRRRRANINPALGQCIVFAGLQRGDRSPHCKSTSIYDGRRPITEVFK